MAWPKGQPRPKRNDPEPEKPREQELDDPTPPPPSPPPKPPEQELDGAGFPPVGSLAFLDLLRNGDVTTVTTAPVGSVAWYEWKNYQTAWEHQVFAQGMHKGGILIVRVPAQGV